MQLDATYLAAPTEWCPANAGVPMIVKIDGPDIIRGTESVSRKIKVRRGSEVYFTDSGENTASMNRTKDVNAAYLEVVGRFSSEFRTCFSAFGGSRGTGSWNVIGPDGVIVETGSFEDKNLSLWAGGAFFGPVAGPVPTYYAKIGERLLFTAGRPEAKINQTFLAEPKEE